MVYTGVNYTFTGNAGQGNAPFALPPMSVTTQYTAPFSPAQVSSLQYNFASDCAWYQLVFSFDIYDLAVSKNGGVVPPGYNLIQNQLSCGAANWPMQSYLTQPNFVVFQPSSSSFTGNSPVTDSRTGNPILVSDIMTNTYYFQILVLTNSFVMLILDTTTHVPVFSNIVPYQGILKFVRGGEYIGASGGADVTFQTGQIVNYLAGSQTHDSQGNLFEPYPLLPLQTTDPTFQYPTGVTYQYAIASGESANMTEILSGTSLAYVDTANVLPSS